MRNKIKVDDSVSLEILNPKHAQPVYNLAIKNKAHLREWFPWVEAMQSVKFIENYIKDSKKKVAAGTDYAYVIVHNKKIIGRIGIYYIDLRNKIASIGYWIDKEYEGKGIISNSVKALINLCFAELDINRIEIKCATNNGRSQSIPKRLHFKKEGILRQAEFYADKNKFVDLNVYSMLKDEWKA